MVSIFLPLQAAKRVRSDLNHVIFVPGRDVELFLGLNYDRLGSFLTCRHAASSEEGHAEVARTVEAPFFDIR